MDKNIAQKIVAACDFQEDSAIIEIGPGKGVLTGFLVEKTNPLIAVEIDSNLAQFLPESLKFPENLRVINEDVLKLEFDNLLLKTNQKRLSLVGNLPYHITSPIIFKMLDWCQIINSAVFMVQKEVGLRIAASQGSKAYGILSVLSQAFFSVNYLFTVPSQLFYPRPGVDSGIIRFEKLSNPKIKKALYPQFKKIVKGAFAQRRKMLRNSLSQIFPKSTLGQLNLDLSRRPESLTVDEFIYLTHSFINTNLE